MSMNSPSDNSTTAFVAGALNRIKQAQTEQERREIYRAIYFRVYERLNVLARKSGLKPAVPEVFTQDIADGAQDRLEKFFAKDENEKHWKKMQDIGDLLNLAARHMRFFLLDVIRNRRAGQTSNERADGDLRLDEWLEAQLANDPRKKQPVPPDVAVADKEQHDKTLIEFWETFDRMDQIDPSMTQLLEKSVVLGISNVDLAELEGVSESTIRDRIRKARLTFLRLFGKDWPFEN